MELSNLNIKNGLCISLGANIDSKFGSPADSLILCKGKVENIIKDWINQIFITEKETNITKPQFIWSSIYKTAPHGVKTQQPNYFNTLVLIKSDFFPNPSTENAKSL